MSSLWILCRGALRLPSHACIRQSPLALTAIRSLSAPPHALCTAQGPPYSPCICSSTHLCALLERRVCLALLRLTSDAAIDPRAHAGQASSTRQAACLPLVTAVVPLPSPPTACPALMTPRCVAHACLVCCAPPEVRTGVRSGAHDLRQRVASCARVSCSCICVRVCGAPLCGVCRPRSRRRRPA